MRSTFSFKVLQEQQPLTCKAGTQHPMSSNGHAALVGAYTAQAIERIHVSLLCAVGGAFRQDQ